MDKGLGESWIILRNRDQGKDKVSSDKAEYIPPEESSSWHFYCMTKGLSATYGTSKITRTSVGCNVVNIDRGRG